MITFLTSSALAADDQTVIMNTKPIFIIPLIVSGLKSARRTVSK